MSTEVSFSGGSDDLAEVEGRVEGCDEYCNPSGHFTFLVEGENDDKALVYLDYRNNGVWAATITRFDEDVEIPDWNARIVSSKYCAYSNELVLDLPETAKISLYK